MHLSSMAEFDSLGTKYNIGGKTMKKLSALLAVVLFTTISGFAGESGPKFSISFSKEQSTKALDGRMLLLL